MGRYLLERRLASGLSQQRLADLIGSTQPAIARLEAGGVAIGLRSLERIADALGYDLDVKLVDRTTALLEGAPVQFASRPTIDVPVSTTAKQPEQAGTIIVSETAPRYHYCQPCDVIGSGPLCAKCGRRRRQSFKTELNARNARLKAQLDAENAAKRLAHGTGH